MEEGRRTDDNNGGMGFPAGVTVVPSSPPPSGSLPINSPPSAVALNCGASHILHTVSKLDTLAGVAIKYGVEVADIKRLNGLVTDLQMFALKTLKIPLPGRHPPSPSFCYDNHSSQRPSSSSSEEAPSNRRHSSSDLFDSFQSLKLKSSSEHQVSPAMRTLRGYYGLKRTQTDDDNQKSTHEGFEMSVYHHQKPKSVTNGLMSTSGGNGLLDPLLSQESENNTSSSDKWTIAKLLRRRQKSETDVTSRSGSSSSSGVSAVTGKGLALRPNKPGGPNPIPIDSGDDWLGGVGKSSSTSSTSSLQDDVSSDNNGSIWSATSKWSLKPDFQALSSAAIMPTIMFDTRRNKTALD